MTFAILFPGQGSQEVGMGAELFEARPDLLIDTADSVLGWSLRDICLHGPLEALTATDRAQPALFALAYALWAELSDRLSSDPEAAAGHSLGEYTALAASGALSFEDGLRLVAARGAAMAAAADEVASGMAALLGADEEHAEQIAADRRAAGGRLWVANLNAPGQIVLAGAVDDIAWLVDAARGLGVRKAIALNVAGAFHSPLMEPAVPAVEAALDGVVFREPTFPVWANVTGEPMPVGEARSLLARQVVSPVRFSQSLASMASAGVATFIHVGPGDVTAGLARRAAKEASVLVVDSLDAVPGAVEALVST